MKFPQAMPEIHGRYARAEARNNELSPEEQGRAGTAVSRPFLGGAHPATRTGHIVTVAVSLGKQESGSTVGYNEWDWVQAIHPGVPARAAA